ncbi:MAG: sensor histidine kinase [Sphingomicrobium sp.]
MQRGLQLPSGRVIALGRLLLAISFLLSTWLDWSQPAKSTAATYTLLTSYLAFAGWIALATWSNWWLDAKLAGPAHAVDIVLFTALVLLTEGYTSPFFIFFIFLLLASAIRWGWRVTSLTAVLVILLYILAGLIAATSSTPFQINRFVARTGHLVIVSLILIWFGVNQWRRGITSVQERLMPEPSLDSSPVETGLWSAMAVVNAPGGAAFWRDERSGEVSAVFIRNGESTGRHVGKAVVGIAETAVLYDIQMNRGLSRDKRGNLCDVRPVELFGNSAVSALGLDRGIGIPVHLESGKGQFFLEEVPNLSTDHIDVGQQIGAAVATHLQRHELLKAAEESAEARSRLELARDLHDNIVQFLAGAAFRLEAMKRSGRDLEPELSELKELMLHEQGELRSFIVALRRGSQVELNDLIEDLSGLSARLAQQWNIQCEFTGSPQAMTIPTRLHRDAQQLVREAVANAVRHAGAKTVSIKVAAERDELRLDFINDGTPFPRSELVSGMPKSLKERVKAAGGTLELSRGMDVTKFSIALPMRGASQ